jgi:membrane protease YdiL (CAAX protease family)
VLGVALGWLAVRSRSLWPAVAAHVLYNAVFVGAALYKALGG